MRFSHAAVMAFKSWNYLTGADRIPAVEREDRCKYRGPDGSMCAIGCLISDEKYARTLEGVSVGIPKVLTAIRRSMGFKSPFTDEEVNVLVHIQLMFDRAEFDIKEHWDAVFLEILKDIAISGHSNSFDVYPEGPITGVYIKWDDDRIVQLPRPNRHANCIRNGVDRGFGAWNPESLDDDSGWDGFFTANNVLLSRAEARLYLILDDVYRTYMGDTPRYRDTLFSEDLW